MEQSNREITLRSWSRLRVQDIDAIASVEGVDIVAVDRSDMSRALGVAARRIIQAGRGVHRVADALRKGGRRSSRVADEPRGVAAQCGRAQGARRRLLQLRALAEVRMLKSMRCSGGGRALLT